jgi:hypothetical protein
MNTQYLEPTLSLAFNVYSIADQLKKVLWLLYLNYLAEIGKFCATLICVPLTESVQCSKIMYLNKILVIGQVTKEIGLFYVTGLV